MERKTMKDKAAGLAEMWAQNAPKYAQKKGTVEFDMLPHMSVSIERWHHETEQLAKDLER